jgi:fluoride exporter
VKPGVRRQYLLVGLAGGVGALCRFGIGDWAYFSQPVAATLFINFTGSLLIGLLQSLSEPESRLYLRPNTRLVLMTGFCGGYTTFSGYSLLALNALWRADWSSLWLNVLASNGLGLAAVFAGYFAGEGVLRLVEMTVRVLRHRRKKS